MVLLLPLKVIQGGNSKANACSDYVEINTFSSTVQNINGLLWKRNLVCECLNYSLNFINISCLYLRKWKLHNYSVFWTWWKKSKPTKIESMLEVRTRYRRRFGQSIHFNSGRIRMKIIRFSSNKVLVMDLRFS